MGADLVEMLRDVIFYLGLMSPACFEDLVLGLNFSNVACIKVHVFTYQGRVWWSPNQMAVSKGLGLGIVIGSSLVKLPQVGHHHWSTSFKSWKPCLVICARQHLLPGCENCKVWQCGGNITDWNPAWACCHHSVGGLQLQSGLPLQVILSTYNNKVTSLPGSSYGESVFLAAQTSAIGILVIAFTKGKPGALLFGALYAGSLAIVLGFNPVKIFTLGVAWALLNPLITPVTMLWYGQAANIPMILLGETLPYIFSFLLVNLVLPAGKIIQIVTNFKNGHTGQVQHCMWKKDLEILVCSSLRSLFSSSHLVPSPGSSPPFRWAGSHSLWILTNQNSPHSPLDLAGDWRPDCDIDLCLQQRRQLHHCSSGLSLWKMETLFLINCRFWCTGTLLQRRRLLKRLWKWTMQSSIDSFFFQKRT